MSLPPRTGQHERSEGRAISVRLSAGQVPAKPDWRAEGSGFVVHGSAEVVDQIMRTLDRELPDIAAQIREEITRGRMVKGSKLPERIRQDRQDALKAQRLGRIGKDELADVPYTGDESLATMPRSLG
ncbi:hypothetical protein EDC02_6122 [Micromonospora sp. Llam0]|uniref:hypothetical protein n=1 Tax=Micromonospora sp. Llam0 TaxID=2485143 RepID=UPI000F94797B|nr:hypothetical protein [Micromonospora sp. Llam0]ROO51250.1 hypothetical protein EDC02_6122 [Micromonospora sp. Llam0]